MFTLKLHERSPRVTLLQILLKDEYRLRVDGVFGPKTLGAVRQFQSSHGELPRGLPTATTWKQLFQGTGLTVVSSIDADDAVMARIDRNALEAVGDKPILLAAMCNGLGQLIAEVSGRSAGQMLAALRLDGHGNLGRWMTLSVGDVVHLAEKNPAEYRKVEKEYFSYIDPKHFAKIAPVLNQLTSKFAPFGFVEHHGCSLGTRADTRKMMAKLANLWGVPVSVGSWLQPFGVIADFKGPVYTAYPRGMNLRAWSHQFQLETVRTMSYAYIPLSPIGR
jgi:putative peptidoglycan binding protein